MLRISIVLTVSTLIAGHSRPSPAEDAAALLLDNVKLCATVAREAAERTIASAGRRALAAESLAIVDDLLERLPAGRSDVAALAQLASRQRRLCAPPGAEGSAAGVSEMVARAAALEASLSVGSGERRVSTDRFLERLEAAALDAITTARAGAAETTAAAQATVVPNGVEAAGDTGSSLEPPAPPSVPATGVGATVSVESAGDEDAEGPSPVAALGADEEIERPGSVHSFAPAPEELARRREQRTSRLARRFDLWSGRCLDELEPLLAARRALERELGRRSLRQLAPLCRRLGGAAAGVSYEMVLAAPDAGVRQTLDRVLAGYAVAARWCGEGRFVFAWNEIEQADRLWRQVAGRLRAAAGRARE